jgi:hypothetical protein
MPSEGKEEVLVCDTLLREASRSRPDIRRGEGLPNAKSKDADIVPYQLVMKQAMESR